MDTPTKVLWGVLMTAVLLLIVTMAWQPRREPFITRVGSLASTDIMSMSNQALDSAPTTSEAKNYYKTLLVYADADIRNQGTKALRILADFRDRLFDKPNFRDTLTVDDFLANYPDWLPQLDTTIQEPAPKDEEAIMAEVRLLAYLQKYYPQEEYLDEQTGSLIRNLVEDFGYRFVFKRGEETVELKRDFLKVPLTRGWTNPIARP
jgi:hypothetical protein